MELRLGAMTPMLLLRFLSSRRDASEIGVHIFRIWCALLYSAASADATRDPSLAPLRSA